jgi:hypothetical protein
MRRLPEETIIMQLRRAESEDPRYTRVSWNLRMDTIG